MMDIQVEDTNLSQQQDQSGAVGLGDDTITVSDLAQHGDVIELCGYWKLRDEVMTMKKAHFQ